MDMNKTNVKDHHRISKIARSDSSNTMMMIKNKNSPKSHSLSYIYNNNNSNKSQTSYEDQEDFMINAFSWPPRSYTCSFCKREFRSAQALGGHMNVHRKDRARLRQSPPSDIIHGLYGNATFLNLNLNQNPNPNFMESLNVSTNNNNNTIPMSSLSTNNCNSHPPLSSLLSSPYPGISSKKWPSSHVNNHHHFTSNIKGSDLTITKSKKLVSAGVTETTTTTTVRLDLEIGLLRDRNSDVGQDLDLELRLGYSNQIINERSFK